MSGYNNYNYKTTVMKLLDKQLKTIKCIKNAAFLVAFLIFESTNNFAISQTLVYANTLIGHAHTDNPNQAHDANMTSYAELKANPGILLGIGNYDGYVEIEFPSLIPANTTSYVKIDIDDELLDALVAGSLGGQVANLAGFVLTGNQEFFVDVKNNTTSVLSGASNNPSSFGTENLSVVVNRYNETFIAITPAQNYNRVRITNHAGASLIGINQDKLMRVYGAYYVSNPALCGDPGFTNYNAGGLGVDLLTLTGAGASDIHKAIDTDYNAFSELSLGVLNLPAWIDQRVYFEGLSDSADVYGVIFRVDPSLSVLGLGDNIHFRAQNGATTVYSTNLTPLLTAQQAANLISGNPVTIYLNPGVPTDRIGMTYNAFLGINLDQNIELFEVFKLPSMASMDVSGTNDSICAGTPASLIASAADPNWVINWYNDSTSLTPFATTNSGQAFNTNNIFADSTFYVAGAKPGCPDETVRMPLNIYVLPTPTAADIQLNIAPNGYCEGQVINLNPTSNVGNIFDWYQDAASTQPIVNGQTIGTANFSIDAQGNLTVTNLDDTNSPYNYYISVTDSVTGCSNQPGDLANATVTIVSEPAPTTLDNTPNFCVVTPSNIADIQISGTTINWYDANGVSIPTSTPLVSGASYYATQMGALCESYDSLHFLVTITDEPTPTSLQSLQQFCIQDNALVSDLQTNESSIVWYDAPVNGNVVPSTDVLMDGTSYYAAYAGVDCESSGRLQIDVVVDDLPAPTTNDNTQTFCIANSPTTNDLLTNEANIVWYTNPSGGTPIPAGTPLVDGNSYFSALVTANCESVVRLEVIVDFENVPAPTTTNVIQNFCASDNPTIDDLQMNQTSIVWYDAPINGNAVASGTPVTDQTSYYAAQVGINCESTVRTMVFVTIESVPNATTSNANQSFCTTIIPTLADVQVDQPNVNWYDAAGNSLPLTTVLVDGASYFVTQQGINCESDQMLEITVEVTDQLGGQIIGQTSDICLSDTTTYTTASGMNNYTWTITGGTILSGGTSTSNSVTVVWQNVGNPSIEVSYTTPAGCFVQMNAELPIGIISCSDLTVSKTVNNESPFVGDQVVFTISVSNTGLDTFNDLLVDESLPSGFEYISSTVSHGNYNNLNGDWNIPLLLAGETATLNVTVKVLSSGDYTNIVRIITTNPIDFDITNNQAEATAQPSCLTVYNEISPNGDGENDFLLIDCIENFPNNSISVFNRFGNLVYQVNAYQNDWNGVANVSGVIGKGEELPIGTYYYILKVDDENFEGNGWIYIVR